MMLREVVIVATLGAVALASAQSPAPAPQPAFEVASIKLNTSGSSSSSTQQLPNGTFDMRNAHLQSMVSYAYDMRQRQVVGGPDWIASDRFDVLARAPNAASGSEMQAMMRTLLADRFKLATHSETQVQPIYALVRARRDGRLGPQIKATTRDCSIAQARPCGVNMTSDGRGSTMQAQAVSLADLAGTLAGAVDRMVVDRTGITGAFDVELRFTREGVAGGVAGDAPSIFSALQEQLGLKLDSDRGPVEVLVVDAAQRPTPD
jgi:uncharacterized protein (TIGR03435 family)